MIEPPEPVTALDIKAYRQSRGWTKAQLAVAIGSSLRTIEEWESERVKAPRMLRLALQALDRP